MSIATQRLGLLTTAEAAQQLGIDASTVRKWVSRGHLAIQVQTRDGSRTTSWYRATDVWACARERMSARQVAAVRDTWDEVDRLLAESAGRVSL